MNAASNDAPLAQRAAGLLERIEAHGLNAPDDPLGFESRLADDHGWTLGYALAVAEEYRRFLVLTQVAAQAVSPSPDVDEAWHLHLTRTAHYEAFCAAVFGRFLHHEPARSGDGAKHRDMYRVTLDAYRDAFGIEAPAATWPRRARPAASRTAAEATWSLPWALRPAGRLGLAAVLAGVVGGVLLEQAGLLDALQAIGPVAFLVGAFAATTALAWIGLRAAAPSDEAIARDQLEPYEAAWLSGGAPRMAMTAIVALTERGLLLAPGQPPERGARPLIPVNRTVQAHCIHPVELACLAAATDEGLRLGDASDALQALAAGIEQRLVAAGIARDPAVIPLRRARALAGMVLLVAVEVERIVHAFGTRHRIGFLAMLALAGIGVLLALARPQVRASTRSERALRPLRLAAGLQGTSPRAGQALAFGVALIGGTALADDLRFDGLTQQVDASRAAWAKRRRAGRVDDSTGLGSAIVSSCGSSCGSGASSDAGSGGASSCSGGASSCSGGSSCGGGSGCGGGSSS